jgi:hypothetical protein
MAIRIRKAAAPTSGLELLETIAIAIGVSKLMNSQETASGQKRRATVRMPRTEGGANDGRVY